MKHFIVLSFILLFCLPANAQYNFKNLNTISCTPVKSQDRTGTCWSFATASFTESELMRLGHPEIDLSEMFVVRNVYMNKAKNYVLRQGKANFSQGSLSHDLMRTIGKHGMVPESVFSGKLAEAKHDHSEMEAAMKGFLDGVMKSKRVSDKWPIALEAIMNVYLGQAPETFEYAGKSFTPQSFYESFKLRAEDYVSITSFAHHPFYSSFVLEIPDNYSNGQFYNVPLNELRAIADKALKNGFSIAWDGDVSEKGFSAKEGIAVLPEDSNREDLFTKPGKEMPVNQSIRQSYFESYSTTDDHLMHLVGDAKDQNGNRYYLIKNSWGPISDYKGYLYMSEAYFDMKTVAIMVHKDAIPENIRKKLNL